VTYDNNVTLSQLQHHILNENAALYSLDPDGYATSPTTLDDPEDEQYFPTPHNQRHHHHHMPTSSSTLSSTSQASQQHPSTQSFQHAPKRLGGRKTDPLITGMTDCSGLLAGQEQQQQQQPTLSSSSYPHINNNSNNNSIHTTSLP
jgi:hypothetical protein